MPTYAYRCSACGKEFEEFQRISEDPLVTCPSCGKDTLARIMGTGAGVIFKGSGFYLTDYRKEPEKKTDKPAEKKDPPKSGTGSPDPPKKD
jgi:putative FmdB family regulatory protein